MTMLPEQALSGQNASPSPAATAPPTATTGLRLGGARADFVAGLGKKVTDLRGACAKVRANASDIALREELRRKLNALSSASKLMKFDAMDRAVAEAIGIIDRTDLDAPLDAVDLDAIEQTLDDLPALAWGAGEAAISGKMAIAKSAPPTYAVLIVGTAHIAEALLEDVQCEGGVDASYGPSKVTFGCESTPDAQAAFDLARTTEPDLVILDADLEYATELVEALMDDPLTERAPIVVIGSFQEPGEESRYRAMGVAKTLAKPTSKVTLRQECELALEARRGPLKKNLPPLTDAAFGDRSRTRLRGPATEVRLQGRKIIVADDDPAVVWFLADLLKASGCIVYEAFDGREALELAYRTNPDLVLCDIMMPKVDGFALCRALRRDVALRDVPVILLSWKDDLLQRVRELGAGAAGYIRKESDTRAIVARIREALRPRAHVELRLRNDESGEVRGRIDGISVRTLLEIVCATRPSARVAVRDASFNYEIEIRDGAPLKATRTAGDGTVLSGTKVLAAMLGIAAGRFTITTSDAVIESQLDGNLAAQLEKPIAKARAATSLLTGAGTAKRAQVRLEPQLLEDYLRAMPDALRALAVRLAEGCSPILLMTEGGCEATLVEDLICDLAARGVITSIEGEFEDDLLAPEIARLAAHADARAKVAPRTATPAPLPANECAEDPAPPCESPEASVAGSLEDAVMREIATRSPEPLAMRTARPAMVDPKVLHPRKSPVPPAVDDFTPPHDQILALGEATVIDDTTYGDEAAPDERSIPIDESIALSLTERRDARTPMTTVTSSDERAAGVPLNRRAWPMVALVAASGIVAWAIIHFSFAPSPQKQVQTAAPDPISLEVPGAPAGVTYTAVTASNVPAGQGVLEVSVPGDAVILVDGTDRGRGGVSLPLFAGKHDVRIGGTSNDLAKLVEVRPALVAHVKF